MMENDLIYYAFISYNHQDERWAKRIHRMLLHYRLPSIARTELGGDIRIKPIFRYVTNLPLGHLREQITKELEASKYLIVICSPHSAQPNVRGEHWVNDEVKHFIKIGRRDHVIPVIVGGEPDVGGAKECFPPALRSVGIAGADMIHGTKQDRKIAFLKLVAKLLDLLPDKLIDYAKAEERRLRWLWWLKRVPAILMLTIAIAVAADWFYPVRVNYADYVDEYGLPRGIFQLSDEEVSHRAIHYTFIYQGYQFGNTCHHQSVGGILSMFGFNRVLRKVVQAASSGIPKISNHTEFSVRPVVQEFEYDWNSDNFRLRECRHYQMSKDCQNVEMNRIFQFENINDGDKVVINGFVRFLSPDRVIASVVTPRSTGNSDSENSESVIRGYRVERDAYGRISRLFYCNAVNQPCMNDDGVWGEDFVRDDDFGRTTEWWYLDQKGARHANRKGVAGRKYTYVGRVMKSAAYVGCDRRPVVGPFDWMVCVDEFDDWDNNILSRYSDAQGRRMADRNGACGQKCEYDTAGNMTAAYYLDANDEIMLHSDGIAGAQFSYDSMCRQTGQTYVGLDLKPCHDKHGLVGCRYSFDRGRLESVTKLDVGGVSAERIVYRYDSKGNVEGMRFENADGQPRADGHGYYGVEYKNNARGQNVLTSYVGTNGLPTMTSYGYAIVSNTYNHSGALTAISYLDSNFNPVPDEGGVAEYRYEYDGEGRLRRATFFNGRNTATTSVNGYHGYEIQYDGKGRASTWIYFNESNKRCDGRKGYAEIRCWYNDSGRMRKQMYYNSSGNPVMLFNGCAGESYEMNDVGLCTKTTYLNVREEPVISGYGYAMVNTTYDSLGRVVRNTACDEKGSKMIGREGACSVEYGYDRAGHEISRSYLDTDDNLVDNTCYKYAIWNRTYDVYGNVTSNEYRNAKNQLVVSQAGFARKTMEYDDFGRCLRECFFGADGKLMLTSDYVAEIRHRYDMHGNEVRTAYFDESGKPTMHQDGVYGIEYEYDDRGRKVGTWSLDAEGRRAIVTHGIAGMKMEYDALGRIVRVAFVDADGTPAQHDDGYSIIENEYDALGRMTKSVMLGTDRERIDAKFGLCEIRRTYDVRGNMESILFLNAAGKFCRSQKKDLNYGQYGMFAKYDSVGRMIWTADADENGSPVRAGKDGCRGITERDEYGRIISIRFVMADGKSTSDRDTGVTKMAIEYYEGTTNPKKREIFGEDRQNPLWGYNELYRCVVLLDRSGKEESCVYYDFYGKILPHVNIGKVCGVGVASLHGIKRGDVICKLLDYSFGSELDVLDAQIKRNTVNTTDVVVARRIDNSWKYEIVTITLSQGTQGIDIEHGTMLKTRYDEIKRMLTEDCEKTNSTSVVHAATRGLVKKR